MDNFIIKHTESTKDGIDFIGIIKIKKININFEQIMKDICEESNVSLFWQLKKNGEFFISIDFCPAKICRGFKSD